MYRRGVFNVVALLLVALVGSALAQGGTQLLITGSGPHAVGAPPTAGIALDVAGNLSGAVQGLRVNTTLSPAAGSDAALVNLQGTVNKAGSGTHRSLAALVVQPTITNAAALVTDASGIRVAPFAAGTGTTNASGLKIDSPPTGATNNYSLWVATGLTLLGGNLRVSGDTVVDGNISAKYQDVAEWVPSAQTLAAATVASIDSRATNRVVMSDKPYDMHVAGVVSTQPGVLLGEGGADKTKLAHSGRVKVKVDARYGAIAIGDLLVTSATPGHAMRSAPMKIGGAEIHRPGTIIGKALESLQTGQGEILVLLTLQ